MKRSPQLQNLYHRLGWLFFILFVYCLGNAIPLPFVQVTKHYTDILRHSSLGLMSLLGGSNYNQITLFSLGINPMMISMIVIQVLTMSGFLGFDALSERQMMYFQQFTTLAFAVIEATSVILGLHLIPHNNHYQIVSAILIMTTGAMFVNWLGTMNSKKGIGGTITFILINVIAGIVPRLQKANRYIWHLSHPILIMTGLVIVVLLLIFFWVAFGYAYYPITLIEMSFPSYSKPLTLPIGMNTGAMMTFMMGMALITLPMMAGQIFNINWLQNPVFNIIFSSVITFVLFYFFTFMQFNPKQEATMLRNQNNYLLNIRPGLPTQKYLTKRLFWVSLPGACLNTFQLAFGLVGIRYMGPVGSIAYIPIIVVMIVMFMFGIKDMLLILFVPHQYEKVIEKEG